MTARILIVDDDPLVPRTLRILLRKHGHEVEAAQSAQEAFDKLVEDPVDLVISDINMPGANGFDVLAHVKRECPATEVILVTGYGTIENAVRGMKEGAFDYVTKPVLDDEMVLVVERALESARLRTENADLRARLANVQNVTGDNTIGRDPAFVKVFDTVGAVAPTRATVLVTGESGTGKSLVARRIREARKLLEATILSVAEISRGVGYDDPLYFSRAFRRIVGLAPSQYRESVNRP